MLQPVFSLLLVLFAAGTAAAQTIEIVKDFIGYGTRPQAPLILGSDGFLYGTTYQGGAGGSSTGNGTVFKVATDGSGYQIIKHFRCTVGDDGCLPLAGLVQLSDGFLYGTTSSSAVTGGSNPAGTIFKVAPDGSGYQVLKAFTISGSDGKEPRAGLILGTDGFLYGTTYAGGVNGGGTVFKIAPNGGIFQVIKAFQCGNNAGNACNPQATLLQLSDNFLYGTTNLGGANDQGTVFRISMDGSVFEILHSFECGNLPANGCNPQAELTLHTGLLYGTTNLGGANNQGTIFTIGTDGTGFRVIRSLSCGNASGGCNPSAGLIRLGNGFFYGTASAGGANNSGTVFAITPDGLTFSAIKSFQAGSIVDNGYQPRAALVALTDTFLYGTTTFGGAHNEGAVFKVGADGSGFTVLLSGGCDPTNGCEPLAPLSQAMDGNLYGTTLYGGGVLPSDTAGGTVFKIAPDGTGHTHLRSLSSINPALAQPTGGLLQLSDSFLYGTTRIGGANNAGAVYRILPDGASFQIVRSFTSAESFEPTGRLVLGSNGFLFGVTTRSGSVFWVRPDGLGASQFVVGSSGNSPFSGMNLIRLSDGFLYGTTTGTIFKIDENLANFQVIKTFTGGVNDGGRAEAGLTLGSDGFLYGVTVTGGANNGGTIFRIAPDGNGFEIIKSLQCGVANNPCSPRAELLQLSDGFLYGTSVAGGEFGRGTLFKIRPNGSDFSVIDSFDCDGNDGCDPEAGLILASNGYVYGTTRRGGLYGKGTIFRFAPDSTAPDTTINSGPANPSNSTSATFIFTATEANSTFACSLDGAAFTACTSPKTYVGLIDGAHSFQVRATDLFGNTDATPAGFNWTIDIIPPETTITVAPAATTTSTSAGFEFTATEPATFACSLNGAAFSNCATPQNYTGLAIGPHTFLVRAIDAAGNFDTTPAGHSWTINALDVTPPDTTITSAPPALTNNTSATFEFSSTEANSNFRCSLDGAPTSSCTTPHSYAGLTSGSPIFRCKRRMRLVTLT